MAPHELDMFLSTWDREAESTARVLRALPTSQYDFRPDATGRSLGELAWHLGGKRRVYELWDRGRWIHHGHEATKHRAPAHR
jgi:uncharacterized damage-inducible protein DinB